MIAVAGGHVHFSTENVSEAMGLVEGKKLRILAVPAQQRLAGLPDVPTLKELGYNIHVGGGRGFAMPAGVPKDAAAVMEKALELVPEDPTINGCSHILWTGAVLDKTSTARNAVFYGDKAIDRSPCGTGTSARMAQWYAKGKLKKGDVFVHESIIGSKFNGTIEEELTVNGKPAIRPGIEGWAKIYGYNTISVDKDNDPYAYGFQVV